MENTVISDLWAVSSQQLAVDIVDTVEAKTPSRCWSSTYCLTYSSSSTTDGIPSLRGQTSNDAASALYDTGTNGAGTWYRKYRKG